MLMEATHTDVFAWCEEEKATFLKNLETLTNMDSDSHDYEGLNAKAQYIKTLYEAAGGTVELVPAVAPREGTYNIVIRWKGTGKAKIMFMAHYDTVWPKGEASKRPFRIENGLAYGPGVNDRQSSIAGFPVFLDILLRKMKCTDFDVITILLNADEEIGSKGSSDLIMELAGKHDVTYSADGSSPNGDTVNIMARGTADYEIHIKGVESHAGAAPEAGRNAGYELAHQLLQMRDLSDKSRGVDVNWTIGSFGTKSNVIPGVAHASADARITYKEDWDNVEAKIRSHIENKLFPESEITFVALRGNPPFEPNAGSTDLAEKMVALAKAELGLPLRAQQAGGGCDSSFSSQTAPVAIDGFSLGGAFAHSVKEYYNLDHFVPRMYLWLRVTEETMRGNMVALNQSKA